MRSYYRLTILNVVVMAAPMTSPALFRDLGINPKIYLLACCTLPFLNYALTRRIAQQRGTSTSSFEIGLWASWVFGPLATAIFVFDVILGITKRDFGMVNIAFGQTWLVSCAWIKVREAERDGWLRIDPKGPKSLSEALRS